MPAAGVLLLITVVLIVLALVYYLVSTILALRADRRRPRRDDRRGRRDHREERAGRRGRRRHQRATSTPRVDALEGLLVKKAGMEDAVGLVDGLYPGRRAPRASATSRRAATIKAPRISEVYTRGHADARPPRPRGADRGRQPGRRPGAAQRHRRQPGRARAVPRGAPDAAGALPRSPVIGTRLARPVRAAGKERRMQTPAPFEYERATSVEGAIASLQRPARTPAIIAGGHSLLPMMKLRLANPAHLIDINDLHELAYIREEGDEIAIGALTRHVDLLESELLRRALPGVPRRRAGDRRPGRAQPRHDRRLAVPGRRGRGPVRRLRGAQGQRRDPRRRGRARRRRWTSSTSARG